MQIELSNGYVLMREVVTRKIAREYSEKLYNDTSMDSSTKISMNPINIELASEALVLGLVEKVVVVTDEKETYVEPTRDWLDNLPEEDFKKIENAALAVKKGSDAGAKK